MRDLEIFAQALDIKDIENRRRFVMAACGTDQGLRAEVERLLSSYDAADGLLEQPLATHSFASQLRQLDQLGIGTETRTGEHHFPILPSASKPSQAVESSPVIGPYRLLELIGEGGFGQVFVAEQSAPIRRKVALKIIKPGMDSREVIARFSAERQALALMDHPNIAKVFDGGTTPRGLPYFVMELVRGLPITQYCDQVKLALGGRLRLFIDACKAIAHAHQKGIIHRDVKPSNVLVTLHDGEPVVKVIDFGVAKALNQRLTDVTIYTRFSFMVGTPAYMSPEQAELSGLDIDTRTDIYALGVLLYELITGAPPFEPQRFARATIDEMRKIIREEEPPRPSLRLSTLGDGLSNIAVRRGIEGRQLTAMVRGDLDWIAMKALSKDRSQRYETANSLAADVRRFMDGDPVAARPPSWSYLASRLIRRYRALVVAVTSVLLTLVLGIAVSTILAVWALRERKIAEDNEQAAVQQTNAAREAAHRANDAEAAALQNLLDARVAFARLNVLTRQPGQQLESIAAIRDATQIARRTGTLSQHEVELRSQVVAALTRVDLVPVKFSSPRDGSILYTEISEDLSTMVLRIRNEADDYFSIRSTSRPDVEKRRVDNFYDTRSDFHDECGLRLSPDGRYLVIFTFGKPSVLWDLIQDRPLLRFTRSPTGGAHFSADSRRVAVSIHDPASDTFSTRLYELPSGSLLHEFDRKDLGYVRWSPDGSRLAASSDHAVWVYDTGTKDLLARIDLQEEPQLFPALAWSASGELLATAAKHKIQIWEIAALIDHHARKDGPTSSQQSAGRVSHEDEPVSHTDEPLLPLAVLSGHESHVYRLAFHPQQEELLASSSWDRTTRLWNVCTADEQLLISGEFCRFSADGSRLAVTHNRSIEMYRVVPAGGCRWVYGAMQNQVVLDPEQRWLAFASRTACQLVTFPDLRPLARLPLSFTRGLGLAWDHQRSQLLVGSSLGLFAVPITCSTDATLAVGPAQLLVSTASPQNSSVACSRDGRWVVVHQDYEWAPIVLDRESGTAHRWYRPQRAGEVTAVSPDGRWLALCTVGGNVIVTVPASKTTVAEFPVPSERIGLAFSGDGRRLAIVSPTDCQWVDTESWTRLGAYRPTALAKQPAFNGNGTTLAVPLEKGDLGILHVANQRLVTRLIHPHPPRLYTTLSYSDDDAYLLAANESRGATIWDMRSICHELQELGLIWPDVTPLTKPKPRKQSIQRVEVLPGDLESMRELTEIAKRFPPEDQIAMISQRITSGGDLPDAYALRAAAAEEVGDFAAAADDWNEAVARAPYVEQWQQREAHCLLQARAYDAAFSLYWEISDASQFYWAMDAWCHLCCLAFMQPELIPDVSKFRGRLERWRHALGHDSGDSDENLVLRRLSQERKTVFAVSLGLAYFALGDETAGQALMSRDPAGGMAHLARGIQHARAGEFSLANDCYQTALVESSSSSATTNNMTSATCFELLRVELERELFRGQSPASE